MELKINFRVGKGQNNKQINLGWYNKSNKNKETKSQYFTSISELKERKKTRPRAAAAAARPCKLRRTEAISMQRSYKLQCTPLQQKQVSPAPPCTMYINVQQAATHLFA